MLRHGGGVEGRYEKVVYSSSESIYVYGMVWYHTVNLTVCQSICPTTIKVEYHNALYHTQICVTLSMSSCCT